MKYLGAFLLLVVLVFSVWPAASLWHIIWQDRQLPQRHPDYAVVGGKRLVKVAAACCTVVALASLYGVLWLLK
jgi:hypothetical protein